MKQHVSIWDDHDVYEYPIENEFLKLTALNYGASITGIYMKKSANPQENLVASFDHYEDYKVQGGPYLNAILGPVAGRIAYGTYKMDHQLHQVSINNGLHHLHGGIQGIAKQFFQVESDETTLRFHLEAHHEIDGFATGIYTYQVSYRLLGEQFIIEYLGTPPCLSLMNMSTHLYFNLSGDLQEPITTHDFRIPAHQKLNIHPDGHPYQFSNIEKNSAFDFLQTRNIQENLEIGNSEFEITKAYDTPFLLEEGEIMLSHAKSKRCLSIQSDAPSVVVYTANYFDSQLLLNGGKKGYPLCAIALETQDIPNLVNLDFDHFTSPFYSPEHPYHQKTYYTFSILE